MAFTVLLAGCGGESMDAIAHDVRAKNPAAAKQLCTKLRVVSNREDLKKQLDRMTIDERKVFVDDLRTSFAKDIDGVEKWNFGQARDLALALYVLC
jgi:hypothetical protein